MAVLVRNDRPDLVVSPGDAGGLGIRQEDDETAVNSEIELLKSHDLLSEIVRTFDLGASESGARGKSAEPGSIPFEKAVKKLDRKLVAEAVRKSDVIQIGYSTTSPELARSVLTKVAELYLDAHVRVHGSAGTQPFFQAQAAHYETEMHEAQESLNQFNRANDIVALDSQKQVLLEKASDFDADLRRTQASSAEIANRSAELQRELASAQARVTTQSRVVPNEYSVERLNTMLAELENRRTQALVKFRPDDRVVKEIDQEIAQTTAALQKTTKLYSVEESTDRNPLLNQLQSEASSATVQEYGLKARVDSLSTALRGFRERLTELDSIARKHDDLTRAYSQAEENFRLYTRKSEEARIANALDHQKIANVVITENPTVQPQPSSPNIPLNLSLGILFAGAAAIAASSRPRMNNPSILSPGELEAMTGIAVLAAIPIEAPQELTAALSRASI